VSGSSSCFVGLHRGEGFGLTMGEAMAYGKPVIATGYSGNLTFMTSETSYLVPYELTPIPDTAEPYPASGVWANPDVDRAAEHMRRVVAQREEAEELGRRAREHVADKLSPDRMGTFLRDRIGEIQGARTASDAKARDRFAIRGSSRFGPFGRLARRGLHRVSRSAVGSGSGAET